MFLKRRVEGAGSWITYTGCGLLCALIHIVLGNVSSLTTSFKNHFDFSSAAMMLYAFGADFYHRYELNLERPAFFYLPTPPGFSGIFYILIIRFRYALGYSVLLAHFLGVVHLSILYFLSFYSNMFSLSIGYSGLEYLRYWDYNPTPHYTGGIPEADKYEHQILRSITSSCSAVLISSFERTSRNSLSVRCLLRCSREISLSWQR